MCHTPEISAKTTVDRVAPDDQQVGDQVASPPGKPSILTVSRLGTLNKNNQNTTTQQYSQKPRTVDPCNSEDYI